MRPARLLTAGTLLALALAGCGGGGDGTTTSSTAAGTTPARTTAAKRGQKPKGSGKQEGSTADRKLAADVPASEPKRSGDEVVIPPISSAAVAGTKAAAPGVKTAKGGDNTVQRYGAESRAGERTAAARVLQAYVNARAAADWAAACSVLAQRPRAQLEQLAAKAQATGRNISGCAAMLRALSPTGPNIARGLSKAIGEVLSFRVRSDSNVAFLLFVGPPGRTLYSMPMHLEGDEWKVGLLAPSALPV